MAALMVVFRVAALLVVLYVAGTGGYGAVLGAQIHKAKAQSAFLNLGAQILGRDQVEGMVVRKVRVSPFFTDSPAFWIGLRLTE